ncbi:MAG: N-acetylneuraminate synthase family protein [Acidimicrobiia bacterium]
MPETIQIGDRRVGSGEPVFVAAEIGINHNGSIDTALRLVDAAADAGCDAVKFQKRTPELCVPRDYWDHMRDTPWGRISYIEYRRRIELSREDYTRIVDRCEEHGILWFASSWDEDALAFVEELDPPCHKLASSSLTDLPLLRHHRETGRAIILSTGMSTMEQIREAVSTLDRDRLIVAHSTSTYPCPPHELNLRMIHTLRDEFDLPVGYSGHEVGLQTTIAAVALGACYIERHITLDRAMWGTDQAASVEPHGIGRLVRDIRVIEAALGKGVKEVYSSEIPSMEKLRRVR